MVVMNYCSHKNFVPMKINHELKGNDCSSGTGVDSQSDSHSLVSSSNPLQCTGWPRALTVVLIQPGLRSCCVMTVKFWWWNVCLIVVESAKPDSASRLWRTALMSRAHDTGALVKMWDSQSVFSMTSVESHGEVVNNERVSEWLEWFFCPLCRCVAAPNTYICSELCAGLMRQMCGLYLWKHSISWFMVL